MFALTSVIGQLAGALIQLGVLCIDIKQGNGNYYFMKMIFYITFLNVFLIHIFRKTEQYMMRIIELLYYGETLFNIQIHYILLL